MMPRDSRIAATGPVFPSFLLPSFKFCRRSSAASASSASTEPSADAAPPTPPSSHGSDPPSPAQHRPRSRLCRAAPDTLRCMACATDLALASQIVSKGFTGRYGRAFLVAPPPPPAKQTLANIRVGRCEDRQLVTGWHVVVDICCATCSRKLGWQYVAAKEPSQKYKVGKFILEVERVVAHRGWEHLAPDDGSQDGRMAAPGAADGDVQFDSDDDDECDDIFAGVWNAKTVAWRRSDAAGRRPSTSD